MQYPKWAPYRLLEMHQMRSKYQTVELGISSDYVVLERLITHPDMEKVWRSLTKRAEKSGKYHQEKEDKIQTGYIPPHHGQWQIDYWINCSQFFSGPLGPERKTRSELNELTDKAARKAKELAYLIDEIDVTTSVWCALTERQANFVWSSFGSSSDPVISNPTKNPLLENAANGSMNRFLEYAMHRHPELGKYLRQLASYLEALPIEVDKRRAVKNLGAENKPKERTQRNYFVRKLSRYVKNVYGTPLYLVVAATARAVLQDEAIDEQTVHHLVRQNP